jgi:hypothetical protein
MTKRRKSPVKAGSLGFMKHPSLLLGITCLDHIISQLFAKASLQQFGIEFCVLPTAWT